MPPFTIGGRSRPCNRLYGQGCNDNDNTQRQRQHHSGSNALISPSSIATMADEEDTPYHPRIHSSLRVLTTLSFIPAFPLCVAHGVLSHLPAPAVGLVPLAVSAAGSVVLIRSTADDVGGSDGRSPNPLAIFFFDVVTAAALMVVLVFTWITKEGTPGLSMLAAYATIPLLFNL